MAAPKAPLLGGSSKKDVSLEAEIFGADVKPHLVHETVRAELNARRAGSRAVKSRGLVAGGRAKPWRQKGTGRARVGEIRNPLWRKGGTVFGPQPRSYDFRVPKKVERGALRAALASRLKAGDVTVVDELKASEIRTKAVADVLRSLGATGKTLVVDVALDENFNLSARNIAGVRLVPSGRLTARDVMDTSRIVATRAAMERLQEVLG